MSSAVPAAPSAAFEVRHVQLARAAFAAIAAIMITFSADHSAQVGLAVFSGWAIATALVHFVSAWLVHPRGRRALPILLGVLTVAAGMIAGIPPLRTTVMFFVLVIVWAFATGAIELGAGIAARRRAVAAGERGSTADAQARDGVLIGAFGLALGAGLLLVNPAYSLDYFIDDANQWFTLSGITIGVGVFGAYAAFVAVFLGIAAFSPRPPAVTPTPTVTEAPADSHTAQPGGTA
ncbi:hypothetical protein [Microbacterium sp. No. 7]|uniref:hypothetical protein n=1 Tax=Microbacterium sp. No. 7 TaxID=1714373 RepID=UPI0006D0CFB7|nr:hypothetical protein [Microbacterium sp. No. 7]ALJ18712.1 acyl-CoA synthetase [Microbacterium sp. No. 7]